LDAAPVIEGLFLDFKKGDILQSPEYRLSRAAVKAAAGRLE
jgi:hypothetical protein